MPALTPTFLFGLESEMQVIVEDEYTRFDKNVWWTPFMKVIPTDKFSTNFVWNLSTPVINRTGKDPSITFDDLVAINTKYEQEYASAGLKLRRAQLEDTDGNGWNLASQWAGYFGGQMRYYKQKQLVKLIKDGALATSKAYDNQIYFSTAHPLNPFNTGAGTYANLFTSSASGSYPGACPIDDSVTVEAALTNLSKVIAYIKSIKMPNGEDPRYLEPRHLIVPPRMQMRATELTSAKFIAQKADTSAGGSADVSAAIASFGLNAPIVASELAGADTTWYLGCEEISSTQLGAFVFIEREPFTINWYTGQGGGTGVDAALDRADELEWHCRGRNIPGYGHPYLFHKVLAT